MSPVVDVAVTVFAIMLTGFLAGRFQILGDTSSEALSFVIAQKYGVFVQRSSATILVSAVLSVVTVSALLAHFGIS
jgi:malonate transporter